ncbi:hypothetical protein ACFYYH_01435 [Streptomyces sp. NPDC002018]|uniref:hypothetical protein n=1 Tax=Streptomyces sp. NPDC002018 TaxID=3364629 RepID=UPI00368853C4
MITGRNALRHPLPDWLSAGRLVIAHRLTTVMDADRVIVMSEGRVVEQGPPAALLADPAGRLYELVRRQMT